mmetsp:Transcript_12143/g.20720  ORF Transcript_12143/g.20720 Transcript_12143/m.20720 type:complete len:183 (+) Transcript_12143:21-569(+)
MVHLQVALFSLFCLIGLSLCQNCNCFEPRWNKGINGNDYQTEYCLGMGNECIQTTNHQVFYCWNYFLDIPVACSNKTWDPLTDMCGIIEKVNPHCETKTCVNVMRPLFAEHSSFGWECEDPNGNPKLCGNFESGEDVLYLINRDIFYESISQPRGVHCRQLYNVWAQENLGNNADDMAFSLF